VKYISVPSKENALKNILTEKAEANETQTIGLGDIYMQVT